MRAALALALLALAGAAAAQPIWRCGPDGRTLQDHPCSDGTKLAVTDDRPDAEETAAAREVARREAALAESLRAERHARERQAQAAPGAFVEPKPALAEPARRKDKPETKKKKKKSAKKQR
ncbi:DUF4124 domain-containing protein [Rubrivivax gelatinosus]|uniref:DUF4124 domain-containing protein n=1 Tax=Rubrivivax gelatinosus TaxID=28068 RepID=A0ABS1DWP6_RUBGE|nr:DUF4124 domain-containing protein [Rubrivivax gelatinosus]MBK1714472.1 hypothetical protein [Rubrivivax gelatinosus]